MPKNLLSWLVGGAAVAATVCLCAAPSLAAPAVKKGPGSLAGVWIAATGAGPGALTDGAGQPIPMLPWAKAVVDKRLSYASTDRPFGSPRARCLPDGVPDMISGAGPIQILELPGTVTMLKQDLQYWRKIFINGKHGEDPDPTYQGDFVARWQGDTLVIDTVAILDKVNIKGVIPHTDKLHVVERLRRTGPAEMTATVTVEDAGTFSKPWSWTTTYKPGSAMTEFVCLNRAEVDADGRVILAKK